MERTLVILKSDSVQRGLCGEIISRFEKVGLKIVAIKMVKPSVDLASKHYPVDREEFIVGMGNKTLENYAKLGIDPMAQLGTKDAREIGLKIRGWLIEYLTAQPVIVSVLESPHAVELVRKICGATLPLISAPGTIRGDYAFDSSFLANTGKRAVKNMVHASGTVEEARYEIDLWFNKNEIYSYVRVDDEILLK